MDKREKVMLAASHCLRSNDCSVCEACPYNDGVDYGCRARFRDDIIELLKAQEPRVMTLEEVIERKDSDAVWVEHMDGEVIVQPAILLPSFLDTDKDCIHFASSWRTCGSYGRRSYGTKWRCWTSCPTDERREAIPWS